MRVFVLDKNRKPLDTCHPARARELLGKGRAAVFRWFPFTIIVKDRTLEESVVHEHRVKVDPGAKATGIAVVQEETGNVVSASRSSTGARRLRRRWNRGERSGAVVEPARHATANHALTTALARRDGCRRPWRAGSPTC